MTDQLSVPERAALFALMIVVAEAPNSKISEDAGIQIDRKVRERLEDLGYLSSRLITRPRKTYFYSLTDSGWRWCRQEFGSMAPDGAPPAYRLFYGLIARLDQFLRRTDMELADVFTGEKPAWQGSPEDVERRIRATYQSLVAEPEGYVNLYRLRTALTDLPRDLLDATLRHIDLQPGVFLVPEPNKKTLSDAQREAAIRIGGEDKHLLSIESA
jgi:hypothetical protein